MNFIPSQGFRHAATLLLTNGARSISPDASAESTCAALARIADELVALAADMRAPPEASNWLIAEFGAVIDRMPQGFDREAAKTIGSATLTRLAAGVRSDPDSRDLFLVYVPEDRLSVAAPLAIELVKRRVSVAFAEYEVATESQLAAAIDHGLVHHRAGAVLVTRAFERFGWPIPLVSSTRLNVLTNPTSASTAHDLAAWASLKLSKL